MWLIFYLFKNNKYKLNKGKWFIGYFISVIEGILIILGGYYFIKFVLNIESYILNIILLYIAVLWGQIIGLHVYNNSKRINDYLLLMSILKCSFIILIFLPPYNKTILYIKIYTQ